MGILLGSGLTCDDLSPAGRDSSLSRSTMLDAGLELICEENRVHTDGPSSRSCRAVANANAKCSGEEHPHHMIHTHILTLLCRIKASEAIRRVTGRFKPNAPFRTVCDGTPVFSNLSVPLCSEPSGLISCH